MTSGSHRKGYDFNDVPRYGFIARVIARDTAEVDEEKSRARARWSQNGDTRRKNTFGRADGLCIWNRLIERGASLASRID